MQASIEDFQAFQLFTAGGGAPKDFQAYKQFTAFQQDQHAQQAAAQPIHRPPVKRKKNPEDDKKKTPFQVAAEQDKRDEIDAKVLEGPMKWARFEEKFGTDDVSFAINNGPGDTSSEVFDEDGQEDGQDDDSGTKKQKKQKKEPKEPTEEALAREGFTAKGGPPAPTQPANSFFNWKTKEGVKLPCMEKEGVKLNQNQTMTAAWGKMSKDEKEAYAPSESDKSQYRSNLAQYKLRREWWKNNGMKEYDEVEYLKSVPQAPDAAGTDAVAPDAVAPDAVAPDAVAPDAVTPEPAASVPELVVPEEPIILDSDDEEEEVATAITLLRFFESLDTYDPKTKGPLTQKTVNKWILERSEGAYNPVNWKSADQKEKFEQLYEVWKQVQKDKKEYKEAQALILSTLKAKMGILQTEKDDSAAAILRMEAEIAKLKKQNTDDRTACTKAYEDGVAQGRKDLLEQISQL